MRPGRVTIGISALALTLAAVALFVWPEREVERPAAHSGDRAEAEAKDTRVSRAVFEPHMLGAPKRLRSPRDVPDPTPMRQVTLSSRDRRPGESDKAYARRTRWLEKFEQFERRAKLTEEERRRVLEALADAQEQSILSWQALDAALASPDGRLPSLAQMERTLRDDLLNQLRTFLTPQQVLDFRRKANLNAVLSYGMWRPLDIRRDSPEARATN